MKNKIIFILIILSLLAVNEALSQSGAPVSASGPAAGNKITLDIKGMDIVDLLKMIATRTGMNIVVGKNVTGRVTLFLKDVEIWDAFEIILLANDLAYEKKDGIINVMAQRDYELQFGQRYRDRKEARTIQLKYAKAADLSRALNQVKTNIGRVVVDEASNTLVLIDTPEKLEEMARFIEKADIPVQTKVFNLNYAQADKLSAKIQEAVTKGVGSVKIDERTNKIAVTDYPEKIREIAQIINAFDEKTPQVLIDAQIIEIRPTDKFEAGVDWEYWIKKHFKVASSLPMGTSSRLLLGTASTTPAGEGDYKAILDLLRTIGDTKILSSPRIMALNNQEAKILVGTKDAYITSSTSQAGDSSVTSQTVNFVDVGIKLFVTPTINRDGFVTMKIKPEISSAERTNITFDNKITQVPIVTTSEAETSVMVKDGVTIIIGGLRKDEKSSTIKKVPLLGDVPLIGLAFRNKTEELKKTELVILLTPHVLTGGVSYTDFAELSPKDGAKVKMVDGEIITEKMSLDAQPETTQDESLNYYKLVTEKVRQIVMSNYPAGEEGRLQLAFTLSSDGNLVGEPFVFDTDNQALSKPALAALKSAVPFPPFPASVGKEEQGFRILIEYR